MIVWQTASTMYQTPCRFYMVFDKIHPNRKQIQAHKITSWIVLKFSRNFGFLRTFLRLVIKIFWFLKKNSVCTFYFTQNDHLNPNAKIGLKKGPPCAEIFEKNKMGLLFSVTCNVWKHFCKYLGPQWSVFQTDFCIETVGKRRSIWVQ